MPTQPRLRALSALRSELYSLSSTRLLLHGLGLLRRPTMPRVEVHLQEHRVGVLSSLALAIPSSLRPRDPREGGAAHARSRLASAWPF